MKEDNKMNISRRGFLKTTALAGAALAMPAGIDKVFAAEPKQPEASQNDDTGAARIKGHRVLGTGKATFEVSASFRTARLTVDFWAAASTNIRSSPQTMTIVKLFRVFSRRRCGPTRAS